MALPYVPSDSRTACARCGFPIASAQYHFQAIASGDNTAAKIYNLKAASPASSYTDLRYQCRQS